MRIAVVGPGALGCLLAATLQEGGLEVVLLDHRPARAARLSAEGLTLRDRPGGPGRRVALAASAEPGRVAGAELALLCVKAQRTRAVLAVVAPALSPRASVWSLQNGLGNLEAVAAAVGEGRALGGSTAQAAHWDETGALVHAGAGPTRLGPLSGPPGPDHVALAARLGAAGLPVELCADAIREAWSKALVAASLLPLTALHRVPNGEVAARPSLRAEAEALLAEGLEVAASQGHAFEPAEARARLWGVVAATAGNRSSMLQDVEAGRETEIEALCGALARLGPAPRHAALAARVRALHPGALP